jgi:hypothetical protein
MKAFDFLSAKTTRAALELHVVVHLAKKFSRTVAL